MAGTRLVVEDHLQDWRQNTQYGQERCLNLPTADALTVSTERERTTEGFAGPGKLRTGLSTGACKT
jgi:hypothetical protein